MSHVAYDLQLADAMNDLQEQVKVEHVPKEKNEQGVEYIETWPVDEVFMHLAALYIKYIDIYRKLEECYDQMVHPQKRIYIKKVLECTIVRICEMKKDLALYNNRPSSIYIHLDQLLFDLKYDPSIIEIPVPRYFREDDRIPIDVELKEGPTIDTGKKKKKKPKKKKKKKADDEEKKPSPRMPLDEKTQLMTQLMEKYNGDADPETEVVQDPMTLDVDIVQAIRIIQKNDRGRQGRQRIMLILKQLQSTVKQAELMRLLREGKLQEQSKESQENESCVFLQKRMRGILARKYVERLRLEEMEFLGMVKKQKTPDEERNDPVKKMEQTRKERKNIQEGNWKQYLHEKDKLKEEIEENEGVDIQEQMLKDRREWINEQRTNNLGKIPTDIKPFYDRFNTETPLSPEEEAAKKAAEGEDKGKKGKKEKKKEKGKKKGKKGGGDADDGAPAKVLYGPTEVVQKFDEFYDGFNTDWVHRDETDNYKQEMDPEMAKQEVMPVLEEEFKKDVDAMIMMELENMELLSGSKKKKKKKKGKKKKKKGKKKGLKLPGAKMIKDLSVNEVLVQLINHRIVKKLPPQNLTDFIGEFNYIHLMLDDIKETPYDPSMALIRQLVTEYIIFPLGSALVRKQFPEVIKAFLFYGPAGTGKSLVIRACVHETNSILFDLSPINIDNKYAAAKKEEEKLIASVFIVAKEYQPSIIYIDECHKIWPAKKKGKKGKKGGGKKKKGSDGSNPSRIKKALAKWKAKFIDDTTRITIIGCTSEPQEGSKKDFLKFFDKAVYFPFPDYTTRRLMWRSFIEANNGRLRSDFPLSTLAHISSGYSAGSIKQTCEKVLTEFRIKHQDQRPLALPEFIGPLSQCENTMDDMYEEFKTFTDIITGDKKRRDKLLAAAAGDDGDGGPKKKKKKK